MAPGGRAAGIAATALLGAVLCLRPATSDGADPTLAAERAATLRQVAAADDACLADLVEQLEAAIDAGRRGSARIIAGKIDPAPDLELAADLTAEAARGTPSCERTGATLNATLRSVAPGHTSLPEGPKATQLAGVAGQLRTSAAASTPFVERRRAADETLTALGEALAALEADRPAPALEALDRADAARDTVVDWPDPPSALPFWLNTTGGMLSAARRMATATVDGDATAAAAASRAYRRAAQEARRADIALALAITETGGALASSPLARLADALAAAGARRAAVASVLH